jgi:hemerythrin
MNRHNVGDRGIAGRKFEERAGSARLSSGEHLSRRFGRGLGVSGTVPAVGHELVELGLVFGVPQPFEKILELTLLVLKPAQGLLTIFIEGATAGSATWPHPPYKTKNIYARICCLPREFEQQSYEMLWTRPLGAIGPEMVTPRPRRLPRRFAVVRRIEWSSSLEIGAGEIDDDHRRLVALMQEVESAIEQQDQKLCRAKIQTFIDAAADHFAKEEIFLARIGFPTIDEHKFYHLSLLTRANELQRTCAAGVSEPDARICYDQVAEFLIDDVIRGDIGIKEFLDRISGAAM